MKLNRLNVEQYVNYSSKFECQIQRYVDFMANLKDAEFVIFFYLGLCDGTGVCHLLFLQI